MMDAQRRILQRVACLWALASATDSLRLSCDVVKTARETKLLSILPPAPLDGLAMGNVTLGPLMRKTGSTTMTRFGNPGGRRAGQVKGVRAWAERSSTRIFASVSGYRQVQVFYELGWIGKDWFKARAALSWMVDDCEINYGLRAAPRKWRPKSGTHEMRLKLRRLSRFVSQWLLGWRDQHFEALGLAYTERHCFDWHQIADQVANDVTNLWDLPLDHKLKRVANFLADVARAGYFDDLLVPRSAGGGGGATDVDACHGDMAAWCASAPVDGSPKDGTRAGGAKCAREFFNRKWSDGTGKPPGPGDAGTCTLHAAALDPATPVARAIVDAACALYETDFACFANANAHARSPGCAALVRARLAAVRR
ncbi:hypothetical protein JL720_3094 [Aureococcus anophagefferens]|nr:hypothetical protein JL720_3094 [Aureococcus anophagefferens]